MKQPVHKNDNCFKKSVLYNFLLLCCILNHCGPYNFETYSKLHSSIVIEVIISELTTQ